MIVPAIFIGMSLPIAARIALRDIKILGKSVGNIFAVNTFGAVIGLLLAGFVLISQIGLRHTIEVGIGCNLLAALIIILFTKSVTRHQMFIVLSVILFSAALYSIFIPSWNSNLMLSSVFRKIHSNALLPASYTDFLDEENNEKVLYYKEGTTATIAVTENKTKSDAQKTLIVNGNVDSTSKDNLSAQVLLGHIPCFLHQNPQNVLVIGLDNGITVGSVLTFPIKHVDCVETTSEIAEALSQFDDVNHRPLSDPRAKLFIEDASIYLKITPHKYDVIINEPANLSIACIGNLYTTNYFEECKQHLNPDGLIALSFHLNEMNDDLFKMVLCTFQSSFEYVSIWQPLSKDVIMVGSNQPLILDFDKMQAAISYEKCKRRFREELIF